MSTCNELASVPKRSSVGGDFMRTPLIKCFGTCSSEDFWANAPTNFLPHYGNIIAVKFTYKTEEKRIVQCVKLILPGGVGKENLDKVHYEVSECGKFFSVLVDAPPLLDDTDVIDDLFACEAKGNANFSRRLLAHKDLFMELKMSSDRALVSSVKIPLDFEVDKTIDEEDIFWYGDEPGSVVLMIDLYKADHEKYMASKPKRFKMKA